MSASRSRRFLTAGTLTLALSVATPAAAALADDDDRDSGKGSSSSQQERKDRKDGDAKDGKGDQREGGERDKRDGDRDKGDSERANSGQSGVNGDDEKDGKDKDGKGGDPRGNNGTVKIDALPFDDTPGNEPHVGCTFQLDFFGFDAGDTADITLTGHAPTGGGLLWSATDRLISKDAAGGGKDVDESITLSVDPDLAKLLSIAPHPKQGWHVKLAVDVDSAPGGAKQKVFWIDCPQTAAVGGTSEQAATGGATLGTTSVTAAQAPTFGAGTATVISPALGGVSLATAERVQAQSFGAAEAQTLGAAEVQTVGAGQAQATSGRGAGAASALPFTGIQGLAYLIGLGLAALGVGTAAHRLGRRRAAGAPVA